MSVTTSHRVVFSTLQDRMPWRIRCSCGWTTTVRGIKGAEAQRAEAMARWRDHAHLPPAQSLGSPT